MMKGRAKRKMITQKLMLSLLKVAENKGDEEIKQALWNTFHCQSQVQSVGEKLYGNYCKNRFCTLCLGIRKAEIINKYHPVLKQWEEPYFVTLTVKSVPAKRLNHIISKGLIRGFRMIIAKYKQREKRGKGAKLMGVKSLECNFNPKTKTYNPHFHIIVPDKQTPEILIKEWLQLWTGKFTYRGAQDMRPVRDLEKGLIETVKYGSKIFTEPDVNKKSKQKNSPYIYVAALYNILQAMKGHRVFERFGFNLPKSGAKRERKITTVKEYDNWNFNPELLDWENPQSERLANYLPSSELIALLCSNIDINSE